MSRASFSALVLLAGALLHAQSPSAVLRGVAKGPDGLPASEARVTAHNMDENTKRSVVSAADGTFVFENLKPGRYKVTASEPGNATPATVEVQLNDKQTQNVEITLGKSVPAKPAGFLKRFYQVYADDWNGTATSGPEPPRRAVASPLDSPPFPNSDWS